MVLVDITQVERDGDLIFPNDIAVVGYCRIPFFHVVKKTGYGLIKNGLVGNNGQAIKFAIAVDPEINHY